MKISELDRKERIALAEKIDSDEAYIWQIGKKIRKPSPALCKKINKADSRFDLSDLRPDIWGCYE